MTADNGTKSKIAPEDAQRHLDAFLVENQELESLNARLASFNLFDVLRVDKVEIRHSNVLAWLLTPDGSHGLGAVFLRRFLSRLLMDNAPDHVTLIPSQVELMNFTDVEVFREWEHIDVLVRSASGKWCLLIENKIKSKESKGQLTRYMKRVEAAMPDYQVIPVFLTLEGDDPSPQGVEAGFVAHSHAQVLELAEQIIKQHRSRIPHDAQTFMAHYLETLRRLTMQDQELVDLCKAIYSKHRAAIDLIVEYGATSEVMDASMDAIQEQTECEFAKQNRSSAWFLPKALGDLLPSENLTGWRELPRPVAIAYCFRHAKSPGMLVLYAEVGPLLDSDRRRQLLTALQNAGLEIKPEAFEDDSKRVRVCISRLRFKKDENGDPDRSEEEVRRVAGVLWKRIEGQRQQVQQAIESLGWGNE